MIQYILLKYCNNGLWGWYCGALHYTLEVEIYEFATNDYIKKHPLLIWNFMSESWSLSSVWLPPLFILTESCVFLHLLAIWFVLLLNSRTDSIVQLLPILYVVWAFMRVFTCRAHMLRHYQLAWVSSANNNK